MRRGGVRWEYGVGLGWGGVEPGWAGIGVRCVGIGQPRDGMQGVMALHIWYTPRSSSPSHHSASCASAMRYGAVAHYVH